MTRVNNQECKDTAMRIITEQGRISLWTGALLLAAANAMAQEGTTETASQAGGLRRLTESIPGGLMGGVIILIIALIVVVGLIALLSGGGSRRREEHVDELYTEPATPRGEGSRFEQLLAETQGLHLRVQGGENKGYYRKIERLSRIFLERLGVTGARQMSYEEIMNVLNSGSFSQKQAAALQSIFERCKQGSEHEGEKVDFTAAELIKDLRMLVKQAAEEASSRSSQ